MLPKLRIPNPIVTASKALAAPYGEHLVREVDAGNPRLRQTAGQRDGHISRPCGDIEYPGGTLRRDAGDQTPAPQPVHTEREQVIQQIVSGSDAVEHRTHPHFLVLLHIRHW